MKINLLALATEAGAELILDHVCATGDDAKAILLKFAELVKNACGDDSSASDPIDQQPIVDNTIVIKTLDYEIKIDRARNYGYFEHRLGGTGQLWFTTNTDKHETSLSDFAGMFILPYQVALALMMIGYIVDKDFY